MNPHKVTREFEREVAAYCGSPYAVAVNSCTNALFLCLMWFKSQGKLPTHITIPNRTYVSVPMQIMHAGAKPSFKTDLEWSGLYQLGPLPIWDCARRFTSGMWMPGQYMCTSHHWSKTLGIQQGGMILHSSPEADKWFRRARFDGRSEGVAPSKDKFEMLGWHMYMSPEVAAEGLVRLSILPKHNPDLENSDYPDLSSLPIFGGGANHGIKAA
jgi:dTDP-4-amino-4,6-dideoxygalactose transaminase